MEKVEWTSTANMMVGKFLIPVGDDVADGYRQGSGCRKNSSIKFWLKRRFYPLVKLRDDLFVDGFIEAHVGKLIRRYAKHDTAFLEVGCGDMSLRRFLPNGVAYNAFDLELKDFHVIKAMRDPSVNIACASATKIPLPDSSISLIAATEVFEHIPPIDAAMNEIHRVCAIGAILVCSIPNNLCYKYDRKGKNIQHINEWTYEGFIAFMRNHGFELVSGEMIGKWVELPRWISTRTYQIPIVSADEYMNTNFIYAFRAVTRRPEPPPS